MQRRSERLQTRLLSSSLHIIKVVHRHLWQTAPGNGNSWTRSSIFSRTTNQHLRPARSSVIISHGSHPAILILSHRSFPAIMCSMLQTCMLYACSLPSFRLVLGMKAGILQNIIYPHFPISDGRLHRSLIWRPPVAEFVLCSGDLDLVPIFQSLEDPLLCGIGCVYV
jgi:hypothetical protein